MTTYFVVFPFVRFEDEKETGMQVFLWVNSSENSTLFYPERDKVGRLL